MTARILVVGAIIILVPVVCYIGYKRVLRWLIG